MAVRSTRARICGSAVTLVAASAVLTGWVATGSARETSGHVASAKATAFKKKINQAIAVASEKQTQQPPKTGPKGAKGKSIVVIPPAGASTEGGYRTALAAMDAAKSLGWKATLINPDGDPAKMNAAVQQAISMKVNAIAIVSIDASVVQSSVEQAKKDGIVVVGSIAANTNGQTGVYSSLVPELSSGSTDGFALAAEAYKLTHGHLHDVEMMDKEFGYVVARQKGWNQFISQCAAAGLDCKTLNTTNFLAADITTDLPSITATTLRAHPNFNVLWGGFDSGLTFEEQGAQQAGLEKKGTFAVGFDGNTPNLNVIRGHGYEKATIGLSTMCIGYAMVDEANRLIQTGKALPPADEGCKDKLLTSANVPKSGPWWGDQDIRPAFWKVWGVHPKHPAAPGTL